MAAAQAVRNLYKLYVGNIPWTVGHNELKHYFSKYGQVSTATVVFDRETGLSRNYGFVVYSSRDGFDKASNAVTHKLEGSILKVQPAGTN